MTDARGKINFADSILQIKTRTPVYEFYGLRCFRFSNSFISLSEQEQGVKCFDVYIAGSLLPDNKYRIELMSSFINVGHRRYKRVKLLNIAKSDRSECCLILNYFILKYLVKKCRLTILDTGMQACLPIP